MIGNNNDTNINTSTYNDKMYCYSVNKIHLIILC